ncbi:aldehyde dehydrogenase family protein [Ruminococcus gauvreauii]|uniref:Aldehyde dehydrogenase family protein n=1 Tax=Ruminococcus gauvreauii TaxID=438033 RepID=A0ABY5VMI0_9FIRM|nr:aldehyde dehydrogenase family protein [Ruminococcus gauvreauii]UWP61452.1 aldehyde dehydrogenase family protein [Ruminococcus gauvreauii]
MVTADSDVRETAKNIAYGKIMNSGQACIAPDYALVDEKVKDQFCGEFAVQCRKIAGDPLTNSKYPRIISRRHFERLLGLMDGVTILSGGRSDPSALKIEPTVLVDVGLAFGGVGQSGMGAYHGIH